MENLKYKYYRLGRDAEVSGDFKQAVEYYKEYSTHLLAKDQHIPFLWIHNLLLRLSDLDSAVKYLLLYSEGCSPLHAKRTLKEKSKEYEELDSQIALMLKNKSKSLK